MKLEEIVRKNCRDVPSGMAGHIYAVGVKNG